MIMASAPSTPKAGWELKTFENCIEKVKLTTKIPRKQFLSEGKFPIVSQEVDFINGRWDDETDIFKVERPVTIFGDHTQVLKYVDFDFVLGADGVKVLCPKDFLSPKFFYYFLNANLLKSLGYARHYRQLKTLEVNYPNSLAEQERIVGILDEAFEGIAAATAQAEKNLHNARELFQSVLQSTFSQKGDDWEETTLGEVSKFSQGIQVGLEFQKTEPQNGYVRFIRIIDYTQQTDDIRYVEDPGTKYIVNEDDLVMVRYGTPGLIGRGIKGVIANNLFKITLHSGNLENDYVEYYLSQSQIQSYLSTQGSATMPALTFKQLKVVKVSVPPLPTQQAIVEKLDALSEETKALEAIYERKQSALAELKQSLLQKAFAGEL